MLQPPDFRLLFESVPGLYLVLTPDLQIVAVSDAYLRATMTQREDVPGRGILEVFPDNPDDEVATGVEELSASLKRVVRHRAPDAMAVQTCDLPRFDSKGGGAEQRYWSPINFPVLGSDGEVAYIIHRVEDVSEFVHLKLRVVEQDRFAEELVSRAKPVEAASAEDNRQPRQASEP